MFIIRQLYKKLRIRSLVLFSFYGLITVLANQPVYATTAVFEVGEATLPATPAPGAGNPSVFTTITFRSEFASPPNIFPVTLENGANPDPCIIRIQNITTTGFDAVCLEPINEDRAAGGMVFEYIAVQDGGVTVPLAGGGGSVDFVSGCADISDQVFGPACANCSGAMSTSAITFPAAFNGPPALLTHVQTTNNQASGDPIFIDAAITTGSLSTTGFSVALEQMEAGTGPIGVDERVCYLAAEQNGCQDLDFSSFEGPASVMFQAATGGETVDGHDNGCTTGEGVTFAAGCFSSTPVAIAKQVTRRGNNGGWARRCDVNSDEIILTIDEDAVSNPERAHIDEVASVFAFESIFSTPVSFARARVEQRGRRVTFDWETSAEAFHLGFALWGEVAGEWVQLNNRFIASSGLDTAQATQYEHRVWLTREQLNNVTRFGISSVDTQGYEEFFGPFEAGVDYGKESTIEPVDWTQVRQEFEQQMADKGYAKVGQRWRRVSDSERQRLLNKSLNIGRPILNIEIANSGIQAISGAEILEQLPVLEGTELKRLALTLNGQPIVRAIESNDDVLTADDQLNFYALAPQGRDAIYLENYNYRLVLDLPKTIDATEYNAPLEDTVQVQAEAMFHKTLTSTNQYSAVISGEDPWYDQQLLVTDAPGSLNYPFDFDQPLNATSAGELSFVIHGGFDFPNSTQDHHVQILVNGTLVHDAIFDGFVEEAATIEIAAGILQQKDNNIEVRLPADTGTFADRVFVDQLVVGGVQPLAFEQNNQNQILDFKADAEANGYQITLDSQTAVDGVQVFAYTDPRDGAGAGAISQVSVNSTSGQDITFANLPAIPNSSIRYAVATPENWHRPASLTAVRAENLHEQLGDYLVVAHPTFIGDTLDTFLSVKEDQGFNHSVISWLDIVETYGFGNATPDALNNFLKQAADNAEFSNVLIVGGHSYDYIGISNQAIVNFIPSHYRPVSIQNFAQTDNPFADLDGDKRPDFAIGRWPVRSQDDLNVIVQKTLDWHTRRADSNYQEALLIAQAPDNRQLDFASQIQGRVAIPLAGLEHFSEVSLIDMLEIQNSDVDNPVSTAQQQIRDAIDGGVNFVSFAGHGSNASWGFQGLVDTEFVTSLDNGGNPLLVMPLACHTTNFESTSVNTLAHQWMFAGTQGAVAVHGASVLGDYRENAIFAERVIGQSTESTTLGEAIMKAKRQMSSVNEMLNNWALLGDPALPIK